MKETNFVVKCRFRDFWKLRIKLCERWPGIFIPSIPLQDKKEIKFTFNPEKDDEHFYKTRLMELNKFCKKISQDPILYKSEEVNIFLSGKEDPFIVKIF